MSKLSKEFKSGFIFLLAIVFLVYGLKYLKGLNVFEANKPYYAIYDEIDGLQVGSAVRLNGFNVGMVNAIVLNNNNNLLVTLNITEIEKGHQPRAALPLLLKALICTIGLPNLEEQINEVGKLSLPLDKAKSIASQLKGTIPCKVQDQTSRDFMPNSRENL